jgi:hypothetical protein
MKKTSKLNIYHIPFLLKKIAHFSFHLNQEQRPPSVIFSDEIAQSGAVAGGGTTASEFKNSAVFKNKLHL